MSARMANGKQDGGDQLVTRKQAMALMTNVLEKAWEEQIGPKLAYHQRDAERAKRAVEELREDYDTRAKDYEEAVQSLRAAHAGLGNKLNERIASLSQAIDDGVRTHRKLEGQTNAMLGEVSEDFEGLTRWLKSVQELAEKLEKRLEALEQREPWWKFWTWRWR